MVSSLAVVFYHMHIQKGERKYWKNKNRKPKAFLQCMLIFLSEEMNVNFKQQILCLGVRTSIFLLLKCMNWEMALFGEVVYQSNSLMGEYLKGTSIIWKDIDLRNPLFSYIRHWVVSILLDHLILWREKIATA